MADTTSQDVRGWKMSVTELLDFVALEEKPMIHLGLTTVEENIVIRANGTVERTFTMLFADGSTGHTFHNGEMRFIRVVRS